MYKASFFVHANLNVFFPFPCFAFINLAVISISHFNFGRRAPGYRVTTQSIVTMNISTGVVNLECENSFLLSQPGIHYRHIIKRRGDESPHSKKGFFLYSLREQFKLENILVYLLFCHCEEAGRHALCPLMFLLRGRLNLENTRVYLLSCLCERRGNPDRADCQSACTEEIGNPAGRAGHSFRTFIVM